ncbi:single-stranded DNA-binding protein [Flavobacterium supellecticarium]|uniref:Single-stranded DNA-binding protein n=1 Tax=Flavobacterium supellecticarium TaxID=2565924 RepID=A0A4S4A3L5_9FLAO|nr:single-stranded DNA-binding protein [Flavobacterium supellecticarium]THF53029.1 single-stranded DNA-binding protein [Flavobacterium supellecticarium]
MEITGRLTADVMVQTTSANKQVANFSIAENNRYKAKGSTEPVEITNYFACSYWINPNRAKKLQKGTLMQLTGRVGINTYLSNNGEAKGTLTFHVTDFKILAFPKKAQNETPSAQPNLPQEEIDSNDGLPF